MLCWPKGKLFPQNCSEGLQQRGSEVNVNNLKRNSATPGVISNVNRDAHLAFITAREKTRELSTVKNDLSKLKDFIKTQFGVEI